MNVVIPMAGIGSRFRDYGFKTDKYLLPVNIQLEPMIMKAVTSLGCPAGTHFIFIVREELPDCQQSVKEMLQTICDQYKYRCTIITVNHVTEGPASSVYLAKGHVDIDETLPLIVSNSDQVLDWDYQSFLTTCSSYDGCVLTYQPSYELMLGDTDKHSFIMIDPDTKLATKVREKIVLSKDALVGVHYFKTTRMFWDAYEHMIHHNMRAPNGEFYLSLAYQAMIDNGLRVGVHPIGINEHFYPVGEPNDYFHYIYHHGGQVIEQYPAQNQENLLNIVSLNDIRIIFCQKNSSVDTIMQHMPYLNTYYVVLIETGIIMTYTSKEFALMGSFSEHSLCILIHDPIINISLPAPLSSFTRGWIVGDFEPSFIRRKDFEIGILQHKKDERWDYHYHKGLTEINLLVKGKMLINEREIHEKDVFTFYPNMIACPIFIEDCTVVCIKVPSVIGDKVII